MPRRRHGGRGAVAHQHAPVRDVKTPMSDRTARLIKNDRVGGARNGDRQADKGTAAPEFRSLIEREDGYGNDVAMETQERFPQRLGNLAYHARFPHSHKPIVLVFVRRREQRKVKQRN